MERTMMKKCWLLIGLMMLSTAVFTGNCAPLPFLKNGLDLSNVQSCQMSFQQCPKLGPFVDSQCVTNTVNTTPACQQLGKLSLSTGVNANFINASKVKNVTILRLTYPADGKNTYRVIDAQGCLIDLAPAQYLEKNQIAVMSRGPIVTQNQAQQTIVIQRVQVKN